MGRKSNMSSIYQQYEPSLYGKNLLRNRNDYNIYNLDYACNFYHNTLYTMAVSLPTWEGLPQDIDRDIMERILIQNTCVVITYDPIIDKNLTLVLGEVHKYDTNGRPLLYDASTLFGGIIYKNLTPENSVIIYDNVTMIPTFAGIVFYAGRLANLRLTIDQCVRNMKVPYIIRTTSNNKAAIEAIMTEVYNYKPAIIEDGVVDLECLKAYTLTDNIPETLEAARAEYSATWDEAMSAIGVPNTTTGVRNADRVTATELTMLSASSEIRSEARIKPRIQGAERLKEVFGWDTKVSFTHLIFPIDGVSGESWSDDYKEAESEEGDDNG